MRITHLFLIALLVQSQGQDTGPGRPPSGVVVDAAGVEWQALVKGSSAEGWEQLGGKAEYEVKDGVVTGRAVAGTPNSFLTTRGFYGDFVLEYEYKIDPRLNSGVQIRSRSIADYRNGQVHGYQVEIDPSERAWSSGIYEEGRRGWLHPLSGNEAARGAFKQGEWNHVKVRAVGDHLATWMNGVAAADLLDAMTQEGFIGLQVHGIGNREELVGATVQWRNLRIKDLGRHVWRPLMGETLQGWTATPGGKWELVDGVLRGTSPASEGRHGILLSDRELGDFTVRFQFRALKGNSGFYFRVAKVDHAVAVKGFQAEVEPGNATGGLYETLGRAWVARSDAKKMEEIYEGGEWAEMVVSAHGGRVAVFVNGQKTVELEDDPGARKGHLGFQLHGGQEMEVEFKEIEMLVPEVAQRH